MDPCIFCEIIAGDRPASVVYEDAAVIAFLDTAPITAGHVLVIPRQHVAGLGAMDETTGMQLFRIASRLGTALRRSSLRCEGVNLFLADGAAAGQDVFHVHLHVFPRFVGDLFRIEADRSVRPPRAELVGIARRIRSAYQTLAY
ncbi:MAG: HIT family protein [Chloroflexota bacterium]